MSKVISIIFCLCVFIPAMGMEQELQQIKKEKKTKTVLLITPEENTKFMSYVKGRLGFCNTVTMVDYIPKNNPIYTMLHMLFVDYLKDCNNDVTKLVISQGLEERINHYKKQADSSRTVKFCLQQIRERQGDVNEARKFVAQNRQILAEKELQNLQPKYSHDYLGAVQIQDKIEYMKRNAEYPTNEKAIKDFIALLIYQVIFAYQTH